MKNRLNKNFEIKHILNINSFLKLNLVSIFKKIATNDREHSLNEDLKKHSAIFVKTYMIKNDKKNNIDTINLNFMFYVINKNKNKKITLQTH